MRQGGHVNIARFGTSYMPYEQWAKEFEEDYFLQFVSKALMPLLRYGNYYIYMAEKELADRLSYWAWENYVYVRTSRAITSLSDMRDNKSRDQYASYQEEITDADWAELCDDWEADYLFSKNSLDGIRQRNTLADFLWKLVVDENGSDDGYDYDYDEEPVQDRGNKQTSVSELGWVTNNRRNF